MNAKHRARKAAVACGAVGLAVVIGCAAWAWLDRLGWVRFISALPLPGWLKMILWGWV